MTKHIQKGSRKYAIDADNYDDYHLTRPRFDWKGEQIKNKETYYYVEALEHLTSWLAAENLNSDDYITVHIFPRENKERGLRQVHASAKIFHHNEIGGCEDTDE